MGTPTESRSTIRILGKSLDSLSPFRLWLIDFIHSVHADLKAIETETVFGLRYIRQPIESCFGRVPHDVDGDSGYGSLQENESIVSAGMNVPPNRLFRNEWFQVGKSKLGGYGVFASKDIDPCITILLEQPFLCLRNYNSLRQKYEKLNPEEKLVFDGLHAFAKNQSDELVQRANANRYALINSARFI